MVSCSFRTVDWRSTGRASSARHVTYSLSRGVAEAIARIRWWAVDARRTPGLPDLGIETMVWRYAPGPGRQFLPENAQQIGHRLQATISASRHWSTHPGYRLTKMNCRPESSIFAIPVVTSTQRPCALPQAVLSMIEIAAQAWALTGNGAVSDLGAEEVTDARMHYGSSRAWPSALSGRLSFSGGAGRSGWPVPCYDARS